MGSNTSWSKSEIKYLKENYTEYGPKKCSKYLNRSKGACQIKAKRLNIKFDRSYRWREKKLRDIVSKNFTKSDCLRDLEISTRAGNYDTFNKYIDLYNIDISHFDLSENTKKLNKYSIRNKIPMKEVLVENSTYSRQNLKKRLYKGGYKDRICELCGQGEEWNGMQISLILDHINGVNNDNRIENLRIVCPNCNAGLPTHCSKNREPKEPKKYYCKCGSEIYRGSEKCLECYAESQRKVKNRPSLDQLLKDIEETNYVKTGEKYGVSDNTIRKWIKFYQNNC